MPWFEFSSFHVIKCFNTIITIIVIIIIIVCFSFSKQKGTMDELENNETDKSAKMSGKR